MKRREFLQLGAGAVAAAVPVAAAAQRNPTPSQGGATAAPGRTPLKVDIYSRHLQWLRKPDEVADAAIEMAFDGVNLTVRDYPGHVDPANVAKELPPFVNTLRKRGLLVRSITTNISDADSPYAEEILATASGLGITHFWWGTYRYDLAKPIVPQLEALKPRVAKVAALSEKYHMTAAYHTYSMPNAVGSTMWDLLSILRDFDPKFVGFHYDTGHEAHHINGLWEVNLRAAGPYVVALAAKDYAPHQDTGLKGEGGPYTPPAEGARPTNGGPGGQGGPRPEGPPRAGGPPRPGAASRTLTGTWGAGNGWRTRSVPLGTGMVNLPALAAALRDINFSGPVEIQAEYPNGGAESAQDWLSLPQIMVLGAMKRDLLTLRRGFASAGLT